MQKGWECRFQVCPVPWTPWQISKVASAYGLASQMSSSQGNSDPQVNSNYQGDLINSSLGYSDVFLGMREGPEF